MNKNFKALFIVILSLIGAIFTMVFLLGFMSLR